MDKAKFMIPKIWIFMQIMTLIWPICYCFNAQSSANVIDRSTKDGQRGAWTIWKLIVMSVERRWKPWCDRCTQAPERQMHKQESAFLGLASGCRKCSTEFVKFSRAQFLTRIKCVHPSIDHIWNCELCILSVMNLNLIDSLAN